MKKTFLAVALGWMAMAMGTAQTTDSRVLLTIDGQPSTVDEFMYIYQKNNQETQMEQKGIADYLDLFINFKLKVRAAEELGIDTTESFRKELGGYRNQATPKYMVDQEAEEQAVQKAYGRMLVDRQVRHIAVKCAPTASEEEEKMALAKINLALVRVTTGLPIKQGNKTLPAVPEDFATVAVEMSDDPSVGENEGMIGWVRPFRFVYPFEEMAYNTEVGAISGVFRTPFGFHILKVEAEAPHVEVRASHIMKMTPRGNDSISALAKVQIDSLYEVVKQGADFAAVATQNSDDRGSAGRGGDLNWFGKGQMVPDFENAVFALQAEGEISEPIHSAYGWHIIKLTGRRGTADLADIRDEVVRNIRRSEYQIEIDKSFVNKLKSEYHFTQTTEALEPILALAEKCGGQQDSTFCAEVAQLQAPLFTFASQTRTQADFVAFLKHAVSPKQTLSQALLKSQYEDFVAHELRAYEDTQLEGKYPELKNLLTEYHDGILLFEISLREVWDKASQDTAGLRAFFEVHQKDYSFEQPRFKGYLVECKDKSTMKAAKRIIGSANPDSVASYLNHRLNLDSVQYVRFEKGLYKLGDKPLADKYAFKLKKATFAPSQEYPFAFVVGKTIRQAEEYSDERGAVTAAYQDYLEQEWVRQLRAKYKVEVNQEVLQSLLDASKK